MTIELSANAEEPLRNLAERQNREIGAIVEDAVRQYLEAEAITDLDPAQVAEAQLALAGELRGIVPWKGRD
jgi:predicted transcriptional regulator